MNRTTNQVCKTTKSEELCKVLLSMFIPTEFRLISEYDKTVMDSVLTFLAYPLVVEKMSDADATEGSTRLAKISPNNKQLTVVKAVAMSH